MFVPKDREALVMIADLAKQGDEQAVEFLRQKFSIRVFTHDEVERVNQLREQGLTIAQAIEQVKEELCQK
jgi:uncharacterized protein Smg (DUF494 family)